MHNNKFCFLLLILSFRMWSRSFFLCYLWFFCRLHLKKIWFEQWIYSELMICMIFIHFCHYLHFSAILICYLHNLYCGVVSFNSVFFHPEKRIPAFHHIQFEFAAYDCFACLHTQKCCVNVVLFDCHHRSKLDRCNRMIKVKFDFIKIMST